MGSPGNDGIETFVGRPNSKDFEEEHHLPRLTTDALGNLIIARSTQRYLYNNASSIPVLYAPGIYYQDKNASWNQPADNGYDAFVAMFTPQLNMKWSTHFGGSRQAGGQNAVWHEFIDDLAIGHDSKIFLTLESYNNNTPTYQPTPQSFYLPTWSGPQIDNFITCLPYDQTVQSIASTEKRTLGKLMVYPSPASGALAIELESASNALAHMNIVSTSGQTVYSFMQRVTMGNNRMQIDISNLASGVYFLQSSINQTRYARSIIKK